MINGTKKTALIIGQGSIGQRHARLLDERGGWNVAVVSRYPSERVQFSLVDEALATCEPHLVIIANSTGHHQEALTLLTTAGYRGRVLVEKPLFSFPAQVPDNEFAACAVAYNLRFHPVLLGLRKELTGHRVVSVQAYCGQFLPTWRPLRDYRASYSAKAAEGGGVLRDLSHELDYLSWLFGGWRRLTALGGHFSALEIDSDDCWAITAQLDCGGMLQLQINYLDRVGRREILVNTDTATYRADLCSNTLEGPAGRVVYQCERDDTYKAQLSAILGGTGSDLLCTLAEGARTMSMIAAIESAAKSQEWIDI